MMALADGPVAEPNPFPGLRPFRESEASLFFGRERYTTEMLRRLTCGRLLAVLGTSASGKSSLVFAGLLPLLRSGHTIDGRAAWRIAVMRPGRDPIGALATALSDDDVLGDRPWLRGTLETSSGGLLESVRRAGLEEDENLIVVVDQFEELFRFRRDGDAGVDRSTAFVNLLLTAAAAHSTIWVLLTMRSDFLGECAGFHGLPEAVNKNSFLVPRMTRDELREAVEGPLVTRSVGVEPALVERLLNDTGDEADHLPLLQHALMRVWERWAEDKRGPIGNGEYEDIGTITDALFRHASEVNVSLMLPLPPAAPIHRHTLRRIFQRLTDRPAGSRDTRRPSTAGELAAVAGVDLSTIQAVFDAFSAEGRTFLTSTDRYLHGESVVDITHESLIRLWKQLTFWTDQEVDAAQEYWRVLSPARLRQKTTARRKRQAELWRGKDLARADAWQATLREGLGDRWAEAARAWSLRYTRDPHDFDLAIDFLEESRRRERIRYAWQIAAVFTACALVIVLVTVWLRAQAATAQLTTLKEEAAAKDEAAARKEQEARDANNAGEAARARAADAEAKVLRSQADAARSAAEQGGLRQALEQAIASNTSLTDANVSLKKSNDSLESKLRDSQSEFSEVSARLKNQLNKPKALVSSEEFSRLVTDLGEMLFARNSASNGKRTSQWAWSIEIEKLLRVYPTGGVQVVGHASAAEESAERLSQERAEAVRAVILKDVMRFARSAWKSEDIEQLPRRIVASGSGAGAPRCELSTEECQQWNRRVQLIPFEYGIATK